VGVPPATINLLNCIKFVLAYLKGITFPSFLENVIHLIAKKVKMGQAENGKMAKGTVSSLKH